MLVGGWTTLDLMQWMIKRLVLRVVLVGNNAAARAAFRVVGVWEVVRRVWRRGVVGLDEVYRPPRRDIHN